ncbi:MAG: hypothetical protein L6408_09335, partial [Nanoarchaeota archaeon]|nr:hypothetical protein [Nanoarchaeota archaeon]
DQGENLTKYEPIEKPNLLERTIHSEDLSDNFLQESREVYNPITSLIYAMSDDKDKDDNSGGKGQGKGKGKGKRDGSGGGKGKGKKDGSGEGCNRDPSNE